MGCLGGVYGISEGAWGGIVERVIERGWRHNDRPVNPVSEGGSLGEECLGPVICGFFGISRWSVSRVGASWFA